MGNGALPNGLSYRAHPRLYQRADLLQLRTRAEQKRRCRERREPPTGFSRAGFAGARPPQDVLQMVEPEVEARPRRLAIERHSEIARIRRLRGPVVHRMRLEQWHS